MSAIFPSAVATSLQMLTAKNNTKVTLTVDAGIADTTITVDDASPLATSGYITFADNETNPETIQYTGVSGNNLTGVTRAADNTAAGTHVAGADLEVRWNAAYHNTLATEIIAVEQYLSDRFGITTNLVVPSTKSLTLQKTSSQLILGTTNTTTISATAPASSAVYTIPDVGTTANFVMSAGTQTIAGAKTFSGAAVFQSTVEVDSTLTLPLTSNQIVLGTTRTVTISAGTPASTSRTWTIPDITGNGTFAALEGTQTFSGAKTFSATLTMSSATIAMGANKITGLANGTALTDAMAYGQLTVLQYSGPTYSTTQTDSTSNTYADATGLSLSITPKLSTSHVRIQCLLSIRVLGASGQIPLLDVVIADGSNNVIKEFPSICGPDVATAFTLYSQALAIAWDAPGSTSSKTYKVRVRRNAASGGGTVTINLSSLSQVSTIEAWEYNQ